MQQRKTFNHIARQVCPPLALIFSVLVTITTLYINENISLPFIFISIQVYLNWYSICTISQSVTTAKCSPYKDSCKSSTSTSTVITINPTDNDNTTRKLKYWFCERCVCHTSKPTQHCGGCKKCFHYRDHHCFFIGGCIIQQNMGNFILICLDTSMACLYSLTVIGPQLYENLREIMEKNSSYGSVLMNFCFPIAIARFVLSGDTSCLLLITLFDILFSVTIVCFIYGLWKLFCCLTGRQRYYPHVPRRQTINDIFGHYGLWNFFFPYNGLVGSRDCNWKKFELKVI